MADIDPAVLAAALAQPAPVLSADKLEFIREKAKEFRDLTQEKEDSETRIKQINEQLEEIKFKTLPDLLDANGIPSLALAPEGNRPGVEISVGPYYRANIAAEWEPERRAAAFRWLDDNGHGDMIKTIVAVAFGRDQRDEALKFKARVEKAGFLPVLSEAIPWATLTAWLKGEYERDAIPKPPLETLGATVGRVVKLKEK